MKREIEWSPRATKDYLALIDYLLNQWGEKVTIKFADRLQYVLTIISERPEIYAATIKRKDTRRCVLTKHTSLYYRIKTGKIELITLFDNRSNPSTKKL
jgi:plasmid stabilization system protein ParE